MLNKLYPIVLLLLLVACEAIESPATGESTAVPPLLLTPPPTPPITPSPATGQAPVAETPITPMPATATPVPLRVSATAAVPSDLVTMARKMSREAPGRFAWVEDGQADVVLTVGEGNPLAQWVYVVAAPFATVEDEVTLAQLTAAWETDTAQEWPLYVDTTTAATFASQWGRPGPAVQTISRQDLVDVLWEERPSWTIVPFHRLTPRLKVLRLDGVSPLQADFDLTPYPLVVEVGVTGAETTVADFLSLWPGPISNRDPEKLTRVAMTGVTALTRATAFQMEINGVSYPGTAVAPVLETADIAHVSNEVSFAPDCPYPDPVGDTTFCARDTYFALLQEIGVDVVELSGNHVNDWGADNMVHSLEMYRAADMATFGGGRDLDDALQPALFQHNGNKIAFTGCNPVGPSYAWATAEQAGALPCHQQFYTQVGQLQADGYLVLATLQYYEFYHYAPTAEQKTDFQAVADAGATAVSGSQGHHAQGFDFHNGAFIHYGLGNLFFDQMDRLGTRQTFVDTYVIYDGRLLSVELWTGLIENWSRPRPMTAAERAQALTAVFQASGW